MRIPLTNIWRAFPELDRFTDEQCARFVRAACKRGWGRHVHRAVIALVTLLLWAVCFFGWIYAVDIAGDGRWARRVPDVLVYFVAPAIAFSIPAVVMLVLKDFFLRRRIRYVIRARGTCPACQYSLLGIVVSEGNIVICPECGIEVEADPSLNELTTDEQGRARFTPSEKIKTRRLWTPKRLRRLKRVAIVLAVFVFIVLPAGWGVYEVFLHRQAKTARAERPGVAGVLAFVESHQEPGTTAADVNAFDLLAEVELLRDPITDDLSAKHRVNSRGFYRSIWPNYEEIYAPDNRDLREEVREGNRLDKELAEELLVAYREAGVFELLDSLASARRAVRPLVALPDQPVIFSPLRDLGLAREYARINAARMHLALRAEDRVEFLAAFEANLAIARVYHHQASLIDSRIADTIEMLALDRASHVLATHPDGAWLDGIEAAMARQRSRVSWTHAIEGERLIGLDTLAWFFSSTTRTRWGRFSPELDVFLGGLDSEDYRKRLGTYAQNRDRLNRYYDAYAEVVGVDSFERPALPTFPDGQMLLDTMLSYINRMIVNTDKHEAVRRGTALMLALERYRLARGVYPLLLSELVPEHLAALPVDPWTGEPLRYRLLDDGSGAYLLYSVGPDGNDDGGQPDSGFDNWSNRNPDLILSPPTE